MISFILSSKTGYLKSKGLGPDSGHFCGEGSARAERTRWVSGHGLYSMICGLHCVRTSLCISCIS